MSKFNSITEGMKVADIDETGVSYYYYGYVRKNGEYVIIRSNVAGTIYRYKLGGSGYSTVWTNRATQTYGLPTIG